MSKLRFSDGIEIDASGAMRVVRKSDGYYIVGQGVCCPVDSIEEGQRIISRFMTKHCRVKIESEKQKFLESLKKIKAKSSENKKME